MAKIVKMYKFLKFLLIYERGGRTSTIFLTLKFRFSKSTKWISMKLFVNCTLIYWLFIDNLFWIFISSQVLESLILLIPSQGGQILRKSKLEKFVFSQLFSIFMIILVANNIKMLKKTFFFVIWNFRFLTHLGRKNQN